MPVGHATRLTEGRAQAEGGQREGRTAAPKTTTTGGGDNHDDDGDDDDTAQDKPFRQKNRTVFPVASFAFGCAPSCSSALTASKLKSSLRDKHNKN